MTNKNREYATTWLDSHMRYMSSDLADLQALLNKVRSEAMEEAAKLADNYANELRAEQIGHAQEEWIELSREREGAAATCALRIREQKNR